MTETSPYDEIRQRAARSALTIMLRGLAVRGIGLLGNVFLARLLLPRDFGMVTLGMTIVTIGDFLASGGLASALVRKTGKIDVRTLQAVYGFQLLVTILISLLVTAIGVPLGRAGALAAIMVWSLVLDTGRMPNAIVLEREMEYRIVLQAEIVETLVWNAWAVAAVLSGAGVWGVASAQVARAAVGYVMLSARGPSGFIVPVISWSRVRPLLKFGAKFQGFSAVLLARDQGLNIAIAAIGGLSAIGVWSIVYRLTMVVAILLESLWRVSYPAMSRLKEVGTAPGPIIRRSVGMATIMVGLLVVALGGGAPAFVPLFFGESWRAATSVVPLAAAGVLITGPLTAVLVGYLLAEDRAGLLTRMSIIDGLISAAVGLPLLSLIGVVGLGIGAVASALADMAILSRALHRGWSIGVLRPMVAPGLATLAGGTGSWLVAASLGANVGSMVGAIAVGEVIYVGLLLVIGRRAFLDSARVVRRVLQRPAQGA